MTPVLKVNELEVTFQGGGQTTIPLDNVSFSLDKGEILCVVGESGSGKSVTSLSIMGLLNKSGKISKGEILYLGKNIVKMTEKEQNAIRGKEISMIFQDAMTSLNPVLTIGFQIVETLVQHLHLSKKEARKRALVLLEEVGLSNPETIMKKYPHTLSGGMKQRVLIAIGLSCNPKVLIADEPTTALDVTIQAQIMKLLKKLNTEYQMSIILVTHDMGIVAELADRVLVMYAGQIVEEANVIDIFEHPLHPYTQALLRAIPSVAQHRGERLTPIKGTVPESYDQLQGCRFANRCGYYEQEYCQSAQVLISAEKNHQVRCAKFKAIQGK